MDSQLRTVLAVTIGAAVGVIFIGLGFGIARIGWAQPPAVSGVVTQAGVATGNLLGTIGLLLMIAGLSALGGSIIYGVRSWEGSYSDLEED